MATELHAALNSLMACVGLVKVAIDARDGAKISELTAKLNEQVIQTQQAVFNAHVANADLIAKLADATEKIRQLQATLAEKDRHHLEEIAPGKFALKIAQGRIAQAEGLNVQREAKAYACQRCFVVAGQSVVLQLQPAGEWFSAKYICPNCSGEIGL